MKKITTLLVLGLAVLSETQAQNIAVNSTGAQPDTSAMLDVSSTVKGFLAPRMTTTQQNAIPLPAKGLLLFNTTLNAFTVNTGTAASPSWTQLASGSTSVSNSSSTNSLTTTVNGVTGSAVNIINSNSLSLSGASLTSTVNGVASSSLTLPFVSSVNGLSGSTQTFATGTSGTDFNISSSGSVHTFNIPDAGAAARGLISTGTQTIAGAKTFSGNTTISGTLTLSSTASGATTDSILTINSSGVVRKRTVSDVTSSGSTITLLVAASRTSSYTTGSSYSTLVYNSASVNVGTAYNTSTGVFTAPATGLYEIIFSNLYTVANSVNNVLYCRIVVNGSTETEAAGSLTPYSGSTVAGSITGRTIVQMTSGQTAYITVGGLSNTMTPAVGTGQHTLKILRLK